MQRKSFLRSLPYLQEIPSTTWPPKHSTQLQYIQQHLEKHIEENDFSSSQFRMPPSKKQRTISKKNGDNLKNKHANIDENGIQHQRRDKAINSVSMLLFPQNKDILLSIEPCLFDNLLNIDSGELKNLKNDEHSDISRRWVNVGPAFFAISDDKLKNASNFQNEKCMDPCGSNQNDQNPSFSKLEQDPALCLFEAAIVIDSYADISEKNKSYPTSLNSPNISLTKSTKTLHPQTTEHGISPGMSSNTTKNNNNIIHDRDDTPNSNSTLSLSQSPISSLKLSKYSLRQSIHINSIHQQSVSNNDAYLSRINSSNTSISLYFRFERKYIFLVDCDQMLNILNNVVGVKEIQQKNNINETSASHVSKNIPDNDNKVNIPQIPPNMTIQFQACLFRIFPLCSVSSTSNDNSITKEIPKEAERAKKASDTNILNEDNKKEISLPIMMEEAFTLMQLMFNVKRDKKKMLTLYYLAVEYRKRNCDNYKHMQHQLSKQVQKQNANICNEGSSDVEPGQVDEQALNHSPQDSDLKHQQLKNEELGDREEEETMQNENQIKNKEEPNNNDKKDLASFPSNRATKNDIINKVALESNNTISDIKKTEHGNQQDIKTKIINSHSILSNNLREKLLKNKKSWKAIQTIFDNYCNFDSNHTTSISKDDEKDLSNLLTIAAEGLSFSFLDEDMMDLKEQKQDKMKDFKQPPQTSQSNKEDSLKRCVDGEVLTNEYCEKKLHDAQSKIDSFLAQLFPAPSLTKNGRKIRYKTKSTKKNTIASPLPTTHQLNTQVTTPSSTNIGIPSQLSQTEVIEQSELTLEQLVQQYEKNLMQKHRLSLLPPRLP